MNYLVQSPLYLCLPIIYSQEKAECEKIRVVYVPVWRWGRQGGELGIWGSEHRNALSGVDASLLFSVEPTHPVSLKSTLFQSILLPKPHSGVGGQ